MTNPLEAAARAKIKNLRGYILINGVRTKLTAEHLRQIVEFRDGKWFWKTRDRSFFSSDWECKSWNKRWSMQQTFLEQKGHRYCEASIQGVDYKVHRLVWLYHFGEWPSGQIDHINGDPSDNRIENLRDVTPAENTKNACIYKCNKSGVTGVGWHKNTGKWRAFVRVDRHCQHLGLFAKKEDAIKARKDAEKRLGFHVNHGRSPNG